MAANESTDSLGLAHDKQWARKYLLDPLTAPEPNQETGPGSSFISPLYRSASQSQKVSSSPATTPQQQHVSIYATPPPSASPKTSSFSLSNLFRRASLRQRSDKRPAVLQSTGRSRSAESDITTGAGVFGKTTNTAGIPTPVTSPTTTKYPPSTSQARTHGEYNNHAGPSNTAEFSTNPFLPGHRYTNSGPGSSRIPSHRANPDSGLRKSNSTNTRRPAPPPPRQAAGNTTGIRRNRSLSERYVGDMTHRPLDMIRRDARAADRAPHLSSRKRHPGTDQIDVLDNATFGGPYHHGGPYDATLASRNMNPMYSPVAAVKHSNMQALKATPKEFVQDSLQKHVPLQGTAIVPPGQRDFGGRVLQYEEGADLMREEDAPGGAYGRWEGQTYLPDDLKGKGEPSYTIEKAEKERRRLGKDSVNGTGTINDFEMETGTNRKNGGVMVRQRSVSSAAAEPRTTYLMVNGDENNAGPSTANDETGVRRSNTTGKRFGGIKKKFGSIRRKKLVGDDD